jgi:hypothetical protein
MPAEQVGATDAPPPAAAEADDGFESFWAEYPKQRRGNKSDARDVWDWMHHATNPQRVMKWLAHWTAEDQFTNEEGKYIPSAKNFLTRYADPKQDPPVRVEKKPTPQSRSVHDLAEAARRRKKEQGRG